MERGGRVIGVEPEVALHGVGCRERLDVDAARAEPLEQMPGGIAFLERRAASGPLRITSLDGVKHELATTAFPLFKRGRDFVGVVVLFWE